MKEKVNRHEIGLSPDSRNTQVTPEGIRAQLDYILTRPDCKASKKVKTIFRYLTGETMAGREDQISAHCIADKVHNRPLEQDSSIEQLARIQLNQLRRALKGYDVGAKVSDDGPRIEIPQDLYMPVFHPEKK